jgi:hypothetical protein
MGELNFKLSRILNITLLLMIFALAACIPVEKRAECGSSEAYNPTLRTCVPTLGLGNGSTTFIRTSSPSFSSISKSLGTGETFIITVADPYSRGFSIRWRLRYPNGSSSQVGSLDSTNYTLEASMVGSISGTYVVEALLLDANGAQTLDTKTWTLIYSDAALPVLTNVSPARAANIQTLSIAATPLTFSSTFNNNGTTVTASWTVNGVAVGNVSSVGTTPATFSFNPNTYGVGTHSVILSLRGVTTQLLYDQVTYAVVVQTPSLNSIIGAASPISATAVTVIDGVSMPDGGFILNGVPSSSSNRYFCVHVNDFDGTRNATGVSNTYVRFKLDGNLLNAAPLAFNGNGVGNRRCITDVSGLSTFTVNLATIFQELGESKTLTAEIYDQGPDGSSLDNVNYRVITYNWPLLVRPKNTAPIITANTTIGQYAAGTVSIFQDTPATFAISISDQDSNPATDLDFEVNWQLNGVTLNGNSFYPNTSIPTPSCYKNYISPILNKYQCTVQIPSYNNTGSNTNTGYTLTAVVTDKSRYPGGSSKSSNILTWVITAQETQGVNLKIKKLAFGNPVGSNYYINPSLLPSPNVQSNYGSYITVQNSNDPSVIIPTNVGAGNATHPIPERASILINVVVEDDERDNYYRTIEQCRTYTAPQLPTLATNCTIIDSIKFITRNSSDLAHTSSFYYVIPETALIGAASGKLHFRVTVQDLPCTSCPYQGQLVREMFTIDVLNRNPAPVAAATATPSVVSPSFTPTLPLTAYNVYTGMPFTLDPGTVTDASLADGNNIRYQWQVCPDALCAVPGEWINITGATSRVLKWTPPAELNGSTVALRLCLGDDGVGNELTLCTTSHNPAAGRSVGPWQNIVINQNTVDFVGQTENSSSIQPYSMATATWVDTTSADRIVYTAYATNESGLGQGDAQIVVTRTVFNTDGTPHESSYSMAFPTASSGLSYPALDLSMTGDPSTQSLYIAYRVIDATTVPANIPTLKIRRIQIDNGLIGFSYNGIPFTDTMASSYTYTAQAPASNSMSLEFFASDMSAEIIMLNGVGFGHSSGCVFAASTNFGDTSEIAANFAEAVNTCTNPAIQHRFYAEASAGVVTIYGYPSNDYVDTQVYAKEMGSVVVDSVGQRIYVPFVDGINFDKISVVSLSTNMYLGDSNNVVDYIQLNQTPQAKEIESGFSSASNIHMFAIKTYSNHLYLYAFPSLDSIATPYTTTNSTDLFTYTVGRFRMSNGVTGNPNTFIAAEDSSGNVGLIRVSESNFMSSSLQGHREEPMDDQGRSPFRRLMDFRLTTLSGNQQAIFTSSTSDHNSHDPTMMKKLFVTKIKSQNSALVNSNFSLLTSETPINVDSEQLRVHPNPNTNLNLPMAVHHMIGVSGVDGGRSFGQAGSVNNENSSNEIIYVNYVIDNAGIASMRGAFVNLTELAISASETDTTNGFHKGFIKP